MTNLNLEQALECAKNGETIYAYFNEYDFENEYFTMDMLIDGIIEYYSFNYKHRTNIDSNLEGWVVSIIDFVKDYEEDYKEWWKKINDEENDEDIDDEYDKMDEYFNFDYVKEYVEETIYIDYEVFSEEKLQELYDEE